jgi:hypothetical protein
MNKVKSFLTDNDGFSAKDFLMVIFAGAYIIEQIVVFILSIKGELNPDTISVVRSLDTVVMTIIGGVFAVQGVREFRQQKTDDYQYEYTGTQQTDEYLPEQSSQK